MLNMYFEFNCVVNWIPRDVDLMSSYYYYFFPLVDVN